jgi:hypothetical protein
VVRIRDIRKQLDEYAARLEDQKGRMPPRPLPKNLTAVEEALCQTKNRANEDPLNFPLKLHNKLAALEGVVESSDSGPTLQSSQVFEELAS